MAKKRPLVALHSVNNLHLISIGIDIIILFIGSHMTDEIPLRHENLHRVWGLLPGFRVAEEFNKLHPSYGFL